MGSYTDAALLTSPSEEKRLQELLNADGVSDEVRRFLEVETEVCVSRAGWTLRVWSGVKWYLADVTPGPDFVESFVDAAETSLNENEGLRFVRVGEDVSEDGADMRVEDTTVSAIAIPQGLYVCARLVLKRDGDANEPDTLIGDAANLGVVQSRTNESLKDVSRLLREASTAIGVVHGRVQQMLT